MWLVYVLVAAVGLGAGAAMQKHGMATLLPRLSVRTILRDFGRVVRAILSSPVWLAGGALNLLGALCLVLAIDAGELSVVQPLTNLNLVVSVLAGVFVLGEKLSVRENWAIAGLLAGAALLSISGLQSAGAAAVVPSSLLSVSTAACLGAVALLHLCGRALGSRLRPEVVLGASAGLIYGLGTVCVKVLALRVHGLGSVGAVALVAAASPALWGVLVFNGVAYFFEQLAFAHGRVAVVDPLCTGGAVALPVATGVLALSEHMDLLRGAGISLLVAALAMLLWHRSPKERAGAAT